MSFMLFGKTICIVASKNKSLVGLTGKVIDETKYTIVLLVGNEKKRLIKQTITFKFDGKVIVGSTIIGIPQDRLKIKWKQK